MAKTPEFPLQGAWVQSPIREQIPHAQLRVHTQQLKILHVATKTRCGQLKKKEPDTWSTCALSVLVAQSCPTPCNTMDCNLLVSPVHGIYQASILEWVAISFSNVCTGHFQIKKPTLWTQKSVAWPLQPVTQRHSLPAADFHPYLYPTNTSYARWGTCSTWPNSIQLPVLIPTFNNVLIIKSIFSYFIQLKMSSLKGRPQFFFKQNT